MIVEINLVCIGCLILSGVAGFVIFVLPTGFFKSLWEIGNKTRE